MPDRARLPRSRRALSRTGPGPPAETCATACPKSALEVAMGAAPDCLCRAWSCCTRKALPRSWPCLRSGIVLASTLASSVWCVLCCRIALPQLQRSVLRRQPHRPWARLRPHQKQQAGQRRSRDTRLGLQQMGNGGRAPRGPLKHSRRGFLAPCTAARTERAHSKDPTRMVWQTKPSGRQCVAVGASNPVHRFQVIMQDTGLPSPAKREGHASAYSVRQSTQRSAAPR